MADDGGMEWSVEGCHYQKKKRKRRRRTSHLQLLHLLLAEPLDILQRLLGGVREALYRVNARLQQFLDVGRRDTVLLCS